MISRSIFCSASAVPHTCSQLQQIGAHASTYPQHSLAAFSAAVVTNNAGHHASVASPAPIADDAQFARFCEAARSGANIVPLFERIFSDQLTPVLAYRCLVKESDVQAPSFLFESVVNGNQQGRCASCTTLPLFVQ